MNEVETGPTPAARPRPSFARLARRTIWVVTNLLLGHFVLFNAYFLSMLAFYEEDFDQPVAFGLVASVVLAGLAVAIIASLNAVLRLLNRDMIPASSSRCQPGHTGHRTYWCGNQAEFATAATSQVGSRVTPPLGGGSPYKIIAGSR